ncbi:signal peptide peptidase SppA [Tsuneonella mangrovi]|uniref:signal peptide peptidase SppA n=1 Tax=Tsuneonella mangrovi TaxID=1982042 RepID=UPI000BA27A18|nr:signal peptide peptidase SppA [Tsuneonella mangrovi]
MSFARKVWHLIVAIKDGLALVFLLLFFGAIYMVLSARPNPGHVRNGALLLDLNGSIVEEKARIDPLSVLMSREAPAQEYDVQDLVHAIDTAAKDDRIKAIALDLSRFTGGGQVNLETVGAALDRFRAAKKPVLAYATAYTDPAVLLASHASQVWADPMGGAIVTGPGGTHLYYGDLLKRFNVEAHVFRVGTYKSAVEPYSRSDMSEPARENYTQLYGSLWSEWKAGVEKARPKVKLAEVTTDPVAWVKAANGNFAKAALDAGLVDKLGDKAQFGKAVAGIVGADPWDDTPGSFASTKLDDWLADNEPKDSGKPIGVITIAGEIVDGDAGPGEAGGDRIAGLLDDALGDHLAGLVVRVDSPGGSVLASEEIRRAILRVKAQGIPVAVSMGNLAASGGYWVSTPGDRIFAEPDTITGSIGIFGIIPTFEKTLADYGVHSDGVRTTPLSGQPDILGGLTPETEQVMQTAIEEGYRQFLDRVAKSRKMTPDAVDKIAQGRVWDGGTARQIGLVDQFGGLPDALDWVAKQAKLKPGEWHADYLGETPTRFDSIFRRLVSRDSGSDAAISTGPDLFARLAGEQQLQLGQISGDLDRMMRVEGMQAYCLECVPAVQSRGTQKANGWLVRLMALVH